MSTMFRLLLLKFPRLSVRAVRFPLGRLGLGPGNPTGPLYYECSVLFSSDRNEVQCSMLCETECGDNVQVVGVEVP